MLDAILSMLASGVFGKVQGDRLLEQPLRRRIFDMIRRRPGIHASELCREAGEPWGTVQYHLSLLRSNEMVRTEEAGRERRFFPPGMDPRRARLMALMNQGRRQEIVDFIRDNPGIRQVDVCDAVSVSRKTFRASVKPLIDEGFLEERKGLQSNRYYPMESLEPLLADHPEAMEAVDAGYA